MREAGFRSAISLPLATDGAASAVFTLLSRRPGQFADTSYYLVMLFVLHAGVVFDNASLTTTAARWSATCARRWPPAR